MKKVHIVTDSNSQLPDALYQEFEIGVVPHPFVWDGVTYFDFDVNPREFFKNLRESKGIPVTSGPPPKLFQEQFEKAGTDGNPILAITVGKDFSSTYRAANLAKDMLPNLNITVFSSDTTSIGQGLLTLAAARAAREGRDIKEILSILNKLKPSIGVIGAIPDVKYAIQGGRLSHFQRYFVSALNLIPIVELRNNLVTPIERVRSEKNIIPRMLDIVAERLDGKRPLRMGVAHADAESKAWELAKAARERFTPDELITSELTPVLGIHIGPDSIALAFSSGF